MCHFCRSCLKANEVSKSDGTRTVKHSYHFQRCADAVYQTLSKLVHALAKLQLAKVAAFF